MFQPTVLSPSPDPFIVRELKKIDPDLRITWGYERYLQNRWAVERKMPPERYFTCYSALLSGDEPRFVERPIFDASQPIHDEAGNLVSYAQVGVQNYDLAPEYEWVAFVDVLDTSLLATIKRLYWERDHPEQVALAKVDEEEAKDTAKRKKRLDAGMAGVDEAFLDTRKRVQFGRGATRNER